MDPAFHDRCAVRRHRVSRKGGGDHDIGRRVPAITQASIETLLAIISASMLVIATFAVASMVSAYASASSTATPRSFSLVISDDISQSALSTFVGAFIFSIVALMALQNDCYDRTGRFAVFVITLLVLAMVIITFVRWVGCRRRFHPWHRCPDAGRGDAACPPDWHSQSSGGAIALLRHPLDLDIVSAVFIYSIWRGGARLFYRDTLPQRFPLNRDNHAGGVAADKRRAV